LQRALVRVCAALTGSYLEVPAVLILPTCVGQVGKVARIWKSGEAGGAESLGLDLKALIFVLFSKTLWIFACTQ
jgi:hypothetical protein